MNSQKEYRYTLEGRSRIVLNGRPQKFTCPSCNTKKSFTRYVDRKIRQYLPDKYGKCDRENNCGYHCNPYLDGYKSDDYYKEYVPNPKPKREKVYMSKWVLQKTLKDYDINIFINNLLNKVPYPFNDRDVKKVIGLYRLGTISKGYLKGGTTFPYVDDRDRVHAIQAKLFDENNHTVKTGNIHSLLDKHYGDNKPEWLRKYLDNEGFFTCLFGAHLLKRFPKNVVILVEAPKTAIYGTLYFGFPEDLKPLWLAVYNLTSLTYDRVKILSGRKVWLFPDLSKNGNAYESWKHKGDYFNKVMPNTTFITSDFLEQYATDTEREKGCDIADFLIQRDWRQYRLPNKFREKYSPKLNAMIKKNPALKDMIDKFDLTEDDNEKL